MCKTKEKRWWEEVGGGVDEARKGGKGRGDKSEKIEKTRKRRGAQG